MGAVFRLSDATHYWKITANPAGNNWVLTKVGGTAVAPVSTPAGSCCDRNTSVAVSYSGTSILVVIETPTGASAIGATDTEYVNNTGVGLVAAGPGTGRVSSLAVETAFGTSTWSGFDANGNTVWSNDANGAHSSVTYDPDDRPTATVRPDGTILRQGFNANSQTISTVDAAHQASTNPADWSTYSYDHQGRLATEKPVAMGTTTHTYTYATTGETHVVTSPDGGTSTVTDDVAGRPYSVAYTGAAGTGEGLPVHTLYSPSR